MRLDDAEHSALEELAAARGNGVPRRAIEKIHAISQREIKSTGPMPLLMPLAQCAKRADCFAQRI